MIMKYGLAEFLLWMPLACLVMSCRLQADVVGQWMEAARAANAEILQAKARYEAAAARLPQARSLPDPQVEFRVMGDDFDNFSRRVMFTQRFPWAGTLGQRESTASLQARAAWHESQAVELDVMTRLRSLSLEVAYLQKEYAIMSDIAKRLHKLLDSLYQSSRGGNDNTALLQTEVQAGLITDDLAALNEKITRQAIMIGELIGRPVATSELAELKTPSDPATLPETSSLHQHLQTTNPTLKKLENLREAARLGVRLARLDTYPEIMLGAGYNQINPPSSGKENGEMNEAMLTLAVSLPLWHDKNRAKQAEAMALLAAAIRSHESAARSLHAKLDALLSDGRDATRRAHLFKNQLLPKSRQALEAVEASYRSGQSSLEDVFDATKQLLETEKTYWRTLTDSHQIRIEIDSLVGNAMQSH